jgi:hypothetical protein
MFLWSRLRLVCDADKLPAICEMIVLAKQDSQHLTPLQASMACYGGSLLYFYQETSVLPSVHSHQNPCGI